ncbi:MAG TPA: hypothetical protein ENG01_01050 [Candidatus Aenigmarchaeota archaeon]|nr:hypothetical protein [Candidatus Aenigmarchaeota archaeon]HEX32983.1 hypothetical protein [Candidatus Aenigmarchaeota archaeon]
MRGQAVNQYLPSLILVVIFIVIIMLVVLPFFTGTLNKMVGSDDVKNFKALMNLITNNSGVRVADQTIRLENSIVLFFNYTDDFRTTATYYLDKYGNSESYEVLDNGCVRGEPCACLITGPSLPGPTYYHPSQGGVVLSPMYVYTYESFDHQPSNLDIVKKGWDTITKASKEYISFGGRGLNFNFTSCTPISSKCTCTSCETYTSGFCENYDYCKSSDMRNKCIPTKEVATLSCVPLSNSDYILDPDAYPELRYVVYYVYAVRKGASCLPVKFNTHNCLIQMDAECET